jgi:hypothetical protein
MVAIAGVEVQELHLAGAGLLVLALLGFAVMGSGGKAAKKKDGAKKKKAPASGEKKKAAPKKKEEPKKKKEEPKPEPKPEPAPQQADGDAPKKGKKGKKEQQQQQQEVDDGWTVAKDSSTKKKEKRHQEVVAAKKETAIKAIPGMAPVPKKGKAPAVSQGVGVDYRKAALEAEKGAEQDDTATPAAEVPKERIALPKEKIGLVVGPKGAMINMLKEKTGVTNIDTQGGVAVISGPQEAVAKCAKQIKDLITKGYCELQFEDFSEQFLQAVPSQFHELIGAKGAVVRQLKEQLGVEVQFPDQPPKGMGKGQAEKKLKIAIAGPKDKVTEAKAVMTEILTHHHSELTHPGEVHEECEVESWLYAFIIGPKGSELKHIQQNFKVRVFIPRGTEEQPILVVGLPQSVQRACKYIQKIAEEAKHRPTGSGGRGDQGYGDMDVVEDDYEPWMDEFMYKRR